MPGGIPTLREMNEINRVFWEEQNELRDRRIAAPVLRQALIQELNRYQVHRTPIRDQETVESLLEKADHFRQAVIVEHARRAGLAKKTDALQRHIIDLARERPGITERQLLARLKKEEGGPLIQEIDDSSIYFTQPDGSEDGRTVKVPVSGLKDRLSRAKKQINSR